jgi:hypothetical protein
LLSGLVAERKGSALKKLMMVAMILAMVLAVAIPALAQVGQEDEQEGESGDVDQSFEVTSEGDNSSQCANVQGTAQTGNSQNQLDLLQYVSEADEFEFEEVGSTITVNPNEDVDDVYTCTTQVNQAASASG